MDRNISPSIKRLPSDVQALIRSGNIITSASQCVTELVLNAIDARATKIAVRVNFNYHKIQVADNGCGMNSADLDVIGERFMTSKCHCLKDLESNLSHYGFRGEALASLKECSGLLTLESRPEGSDTTYAKVYAHGKTHSLGISKNSRPACGTTVTVHDFMYNMPVRRGRIQPNFEIEEIKSSLESIALIHPEVSFSFHNEVNRQLILQTHKSSDVVGVFSQLFSKTLAQSLVPVNYSMEPYSVHGYIAKETHNRKNLQFIYVNKRLVLKTKLHKIANTVLGMSFLLRQNAPPREVPANRDYTTEQWLFFSTPERDRYAVYILNIICPYKEYDICLEPKKTLIEFNDWNSVLQCLKTAIDTFLQKECNTFSSQEKRNVQSQIQNRSLLAEVSQLDKEYALGKYGKISQESKKAESMSQAEHREDNCIVKNNEKFLPGIHSIFGAVCGAQAKRKTINSKAISDDTTASKNTRNCKLDEEHQDILSQSTLVLLQESSSIDGKLTSYKEKIEENSLINSAFSKDFISDHSNKRILPCEKRISSAVDPLKLKNKVVVEASNVPDINLDVSTNEQIKQNVIKSIDIEDNINSTCPIVKFRRMYGNSKHLVKEDEVIPNVECKRKPILQRCFEEESSSHAKPFNKAKNYFSLECVTGSNEKRQSSDHITTKAVFIQNINSSVSGISEVPIIESKSKYSSEKSDAEDKAAMHPIQKFRLSVAKKLSHKVQGAVCHRPLENANILVPKAHTVTKINECRMHNPKHRLSSKLNISVTKTSIYPNNHKQASENKGTQQSKECIPESFKSLLEKDIYRNHTSETSVISEGNSLMVKFQQQHNIRKETANKLIPSECSKDLVLQRPLQLKKVNCCENVALRQRKSLKDIHLCCLYNTRDKKWQTTEQRMGINHRCSNYNPTLLPLWSLSYVNKRKSDLQMMLPNKRIVRFHENPFCMHNGFNDSKSKAAFKGTYSKYITSSDFLHTVDVKDQKHALLKESTFNLEKYESRNKNTSLSLSDKLEYNDVKLFPGNWSLKSEKNTIHYASNHNFSQNFSFIFSPKQDECAQALTFNEMFSETKCSVKEGVNENIVRPFSSDIIKHCRNITLSSGNEADVDTTVSLKTCGTTFLSHIAHPFSERDVDTASEILGQTCNQDNIPEHVNKTDCTNNNSINVDNAKLAINEIETTAEKNEIAHSLASRDTSPLHCSKTNISSEVAPTVQKVEENSICAPKSNIKLSDPQSQCSFNNIGATFLKSGDKAAADSFAAIPYVNSSPMDCQLLDDTYFPSKNVSNKTMNSAVVDISLLLSQRVAENCLKGENRNLSIQNTSNCFSPVTSNSNESSDISLKHVTRNGSSKNLIIEETSSEIIDLTPEVEKLSKELSLFERCNTKDTINSVERQESIQYPDNQNEKESSIAEGDKCENINICNKITNEINKEVNRESDKERKRSSDIDLSDLYGKRLSLEKTAPDNSIGNILSGYTEILNEAFDVMTKDMHTANQEQTDITTTIANEEGANENEPQKNGDVFMQTHKLDNTEFETNKNIKFFSFSNAQDNCYSTKTRSDIPEANPELPLNKAQETSSTISLKDVSTSHDERENITLEVCNRANSDSACPQEWEKKIDSTGRQFYVHRESGMPSFCIPDTKFTGTSYSMSERYGFLPKGLSPILKGNFSNLSKQQDILTPSTRHAFHDALVQDHDLDKLKQVKWRKVQEFKDSGCKDLLKTLVEDSEYSMQFCEMEVPRANAKEMPKFYNTMFSYTFTKEAFSTLKVLGQLDEKFIVVSTTCEDNKLPEYIVLFDQHAVHERIRVEQLMQEYQEEESDTKFKTSEIDSAIMLSLDKDDIRILQSFRSDFENLGIRFELLDDSTTIQVSSVPTCLLMKEIREGKNNGISVLKTLLENLIREQIDCLLATRGCAARVPKTLQAVINSEACKGALKFGDDLTTEECRILLSSLSSCKLPFHCAHGRPSLTPIVDLKHLYIHQKPVYKPPALYKLKKLFLN